MTMKRGSIISFAFAFGISAVACAYDNLWVSIRNKGLHDDSDLLFVSNVIVRSAKAGMKDVVWPGDIETYWLWSADRKARFLEAKRIADENGISIVPAVWSVGYGTMISLDPGLIESTPLTGVPYVARGGKLVSNKDETQLVKNGGFDGEGGLQDPLRGWNAKQMRTTATIDTGTFRSGKGSLLVDSSTAENGMARLSQRMPLKPNRLYRATAWYKAENLSAASGQLRLGVCLEKKAFDNNGKSVKAILYHYDSAKDTRWRKLTVEFFSENFACVNLTCGAWGNRAGRFWMDDVSLTEVGMKEIAQREDSPRTVRSAATGRVYVRGRDWLNPDFSKHVPGSEIDFPIPEGSAIREGEEVLIDTYVPSRSEPKMQRSTCMSDPHLYELFRKSAATLEELLHPNKWYLSLDEVRNGGTCPLCSARKTDMAHILADCIIRQHEIIRSVHPGAEISMPSDMIDPHHNAKEGRYYNCNGTFYGVWDLIPHDIVVMLWWSDVFDKSGPFFTKRGFKVMGGFSCDSEKSMELVRERKGILDATSNVKGFRFTTWKMRYDHLDEFAKIILGK